MKNAPVVVIRNRDTSRPEKYRIRNLITNKITFSNRVSLINPSAIVNVDNFYNLTPERGAINCNWAFVGSLTDYEDIRRMTNKCAVQTDSYGFLLKHNNRYYYEDEHGPMKALHLEEDSGNRFIWLKNKTETGKSK